MLNCSESGAFPERYTNNHIMRIQTILCSTLTLGLLAGGLTACCCFRDKESQGSEAKLEAQAKITRAEAEKIALDKVPGGTIKEGDIEKEKGKLIWSFDIATPATKDITEVQVDALTGQVLDVSKETAAEQEKEKKADEEKEEKK